jgi:hypothetical protein
VKQSVYDYHGEIFFEVGMYQVINNLVQFTFVSFSDFLQNYRIFLTKKEGLSFRLDYPLFLWWVN